MGKHHIISPSSLNRISNCVGSLYGPYVPDEGSAAAAEGTTCHALLEWCLKFGDDPRNHLGSTAFSEQFPITIEMVEGVELFMDTTRQLCAEFNIPATAVQSEQYLVHNSFPDELFGGTSDCIIAGEDTLIVMDLKFGHRAVYANSPQLTAYSLLALGMLMRNFKRIVQVIVQPRCNPSVDRHEPGSEELNKVWNDVCTVAAFIKQNPDMTVPKPDALKAGEWCKYCRRREGCTARLAMVSEFAEVATFTGPDKQVIASPVADIPTDQLVYWVERFDVISEFMKDVTKALSTRAMYGEKIPGRKLVAKFGNRKFIETDEEKLAKKLPRAKLGLSAKDIYVKKLVSPAQVEAILKERGNYNDVKDQFDKLVTSVVTGVKLVSERARGQEILPDAAAEFIKTLEDHSDE
jgi:hypothetical protein